MWCGQGDNRVSVFPGLTSLHLVFHREHNRLADKLAEVHPDWTDEKLFQEARRLNIAQLQNFVYEEFVPAVIGRKAVKKFGLRDKSDFDSKFAEGVTDFLFFGVDAPGASTDLLARNIHRGRDHALPPYLQYLDLALNFFGDTKYVNKLRLPTCIPGLYK
nr:hypothetical protein BaRGS_011834 [Batillaria attramentaria]